MFTRAEWNEGLETMETRALAYLARRIWDTDAWYPVIQRIDPARFESSPYAKPGHVFNTQKMAAWRDAVAPLMAGPRSSTKYRPVFPESL